MKLRVDQRVVRNSPLLGTMLSASAESQARKHPDFPPVIRRSSFVLVAGVFVISHTVNVGRRSGESLWCQ